MEMNKRIAEIINREVAFYIDLDEAYSILFRMSFYIELFKLCNILDPDQPETDPIISSFIRGVALYPLYMADRTQKRYEEMTELTAPFFLAIYHDADITEFRLSLINQEISSMSELNFGNLTVKITPDDILKHIERIDAHPIFPVEIVKIENALINYYRKKYQHQTQLPVEKNNKMKIRIKAFPDYLIHPDKEKLAQELKSNFSNEKGKGLRIMLEVLVERTLFSSWGNGQQSSIYRAIQEYWGRDIGAYNGMFVSFRPDPSRQHEKDYDSTNKRINIILNKISSD